MIRCQAWHDLRPSAPHWSPETRPPVAAVLQLPGKAGEQIPVAKGVLGAGNRMCPRAGRMQALARARAFGSKVLLEERLEDYRLSVSLQVDRE
jgi:hypothetical protein